MLHVFSALSVGIMQKMCFLFETAPSVKIRSEKERNKHPNPKQLGHAILTILFMLFYLWNQMPHNVNITKLKPEDYVHKGACNVDQKHQC